MNNDKVLTNKSRAKVGTGYTPRSMDSMSSYFRREQCGFTAMGLCPANQEKKWQSCTSRNGLITDVFTGR